MNCDCQIQRGHCTSAFLRLTLGTLLIASMCSTAQACGGCFRLPYQSLLEKVERADRVVVAQATHPSGLSWMIDRVIKGRKSGDDEKIHLPRLSGEFVTSLSGPRILTWNKVADRAY